METSFTVSGIIHSGDNYFPYPSVTRVGGHFSVRYLGLALRPGIELELAGVPSFPHPGLKLGGEENWESQPLRSWGLGPLWRGVQVLGVWNRIEGGTDVKW